MSFSKLIQKTILASSLVLLGSVSAHAYNVGDKIDPAILKELKINPNKVTVVDFFASWCISCKKELPLLDKVATSVDKSKFEVLGVDADEELDEGKAFQKHLGLKMRVYDDPSQKVTKAFKPKGMPALYYIKDGKVVAREFGAVKNIDKKVQGQLQKLAK